MTDPGDRVTDRGVAVVSNGNLLEFLLNGFSSE